MARLAVSLLIILLWHYGYCQNIVLTRQVPANSSSSSSSTENKCTEASECPISDICTPCEEGYGPLCEEATCTDGVCGVIKSCSRRTLSLSLLLISSKTATTNITHTQCKEDGECIHPEYCATKCEGGYGPLCASAECVNNLCQIIKPCSQKNECSEKDLSQCAIPQICARCKEGYTPPCAQAACENGKCTTISPCSIYNLASSSSTPTATINSSECQKDGDCAYVKQCVKQCSNGTSPLCAFGTCVKGKCIITPPCSQKTQCTEKNLSQCVVPALCAMCLSGRSPGCAQAACENGKCTTISPCSIYNPASSSSTTTTAINSNACTEKDLSQCVIPKICALCKEGYTPPCAQAACENGKCTTISPCSIYNPASSSSTTTTAINSNACQKDGDCAYVKQCVKQCSNGTSPLCAFGTCVKGKCIITPPCSQKTQCTEKNLSQCIVPALCAMCLSGRSPPCAQATCENGQCKIIQPCSIYTEPSTTSPPTNNACNSYSQCPSPKICTLQCVNGTTPRCASAKCVDGKCITIKPCSQRLCKTKATCPYNKTNCAPCPSNRGPICEQPACSYGICSVIKPCSKNLLIAVNSISTIELKNNFTQKN